MADGLTGLEMENEMETGVRVREYGVQLEFGLEEVEFGCGQDGPVCGSDFESESEGSAHDRFLEREITTDKRNLLPICFQESREPLGYREVRERGGQIYASLQKPKMQKCSVRFDLITRRQSQIVCLTLPTLLLLSISTRGLPSSHLHHF